MPHSVTGASRTAHPPLLPAHLLQSVHCTPLCVLTMMQETSGLPHLWNGGAQRIQTPRQGRRQGRRRRRRSQPHVICSVQYLRAVPCIHQSSCNVLAGAGVRGGGCCAAEPAGSAAD